ncbi:hypothetical protein PVNG_05013 [Plasmodium vivax North Korean]|uniref:VIR protein n=1 Tax=Plasmodium vivax North Korean TaxID=1035514 RepID=A0A0J9U0W1_PLAVI|nr:hypothetical protein PVNG_05013 [Plasmodium vivax North Korean]
MSNTDPEAKYILYKHYGDVKVQFDKSETYDHNKDEFDKIIKDINIEKKELNLPDKLFIGLHKIVRNGHVFSSTSFADDYCIYANYWLNKEFRDLHNSVDEKIFDILHKFVVTYNIKTTNRKDNTCYDYIKYLNDDVYNRMQILISLYNTYNKIKSFDGTENDYLCGLFSFINRNYRDAMKKHKSDSNFLKKLKEFIKSIDTNKWESNAICPVRNYIKLLQQDSPQTREDPQAIKHPNVSPVASLSHELPKEQNTVQLEVVSRTQDTHESLNQSNIPEVTESSESLGSYDEHSTQHTPESQYSLEQSIPELQGNRDNYGLLTTKREQITPKEQTYTPSRYGNTYTDIIIGTVGDRFTEADPYIHTAPKDGVLNKVQDFFTGTLGQVDPVPVVGVSGGMGALFLLFRVLEILNLHPLCTIF